MATAETIPRTSTAVTDRLGRATSLAGATPDRSASTKRENTKVPTTRPVTIFWRRSSTKPATARGEYWVAAIWLDRAIIENTMAATVMVAAATAPVIALPPATDVDSSQETVVRDCSAWSTRMVRRANAMEAATMSSGTT